MPADRPPSLQEFMEAPDHVVAAAAPETMIYAAGGTRRAAALAGVPLGDEYARWSEPRFRAASALCFRLGVRHLIAPVGRPQIFAETGLYRQSFCRWVDLAVTSAASLQYYRNANWRVRLIVAGDALPELAQTARKLDRATDGATGPRLWILTTTDYDQLWRWILSSGARTREAVIRRLFGEDVPPARLLLSFGKPLVALDHLPPLLFDEIQCYWTQRPGYSLTEPDLRAILYDSAYLRRTWRQDKTGREREALAYRPAWDQGPVIGLGQKLGPYWYPRNTEISDLDEPVAPAMVAHVARVARGAIASEDGGVTADVSFTRRNGH